MSSKLKCLQIVLQSTNMERFLKIGKKKIAYSDVGKGKTIVFLHGWMASKKVYEDLVTHLSRKYRCVSIDIPGFGNSDVVGNLSVKKIPSLIHKAIKRLGIKKFNLVGNSFGGAISILYAKMYEEEVRKIILISPFINFKQFYKLAFFSVRYVIPYVLDKEIITPIFKIIKTLMSISYKEDKYINLYKKFKKERVKRKALYAFKIAYELSSLDLFSVLRKVRKDILFIYGNKDEVLSIVPVKPLFKILNNMHLIIFEDVRHYIYTYDTKQLSKKIDLFFAGNNVK